MVRLNPVIKEYIWGTESWEVSTHPDGLCTIANGEFAGQTLKEAVGCDIPVLIKTIDANDSLSLQVHPNDEYAQRVENQRGKNEMWYIAAAEPGAELILGFSEEISKTELRELIKSGELLTKVRHVPVKAGDCYCIPAGMLHAIGKGIKIIEVQQSSNVTYRVYDYDRRDSLGNPRELHIDKAIDVLDTTLQAVKSDTKDLTKWEYFQCELITDETGEMKLHTKAENFEFITDIKTGMTRGQGPHLSPL
ncbi:MAG: class I mannose-6-phosphate isomerase [Oscillospiraceae bacterium]|nr:class I mannose-6-phosphate isomerase [Oscillospiraceae bacterium]